MVDPKYTTTTIDTGQINNRNEINNKNNSIYEQQ